MIPQYNPWGAPIFPGDTAPKPYENYASPPVANLLSSIAGALGRAFMAPGQALQSTTPITSDQMVKPAADLAMMTTLGAGAAPAGANELRSGLLSVARKTRNGEIRIGKPGDIHSDLMTRKELASEFDSPEVAASMGYVTPDGKFLTRDEALQFAMQNEPARAAWSAQQPQYGLDAATYHNDLVR